MSAIVLESVLTCPRCGFAKPETMPTDACQFYYECSNCKAAAPQPRGLLRFLFVRLGEVPADPAAAWVLLIAFRGITGRRLDYAVAAARRAQLLPVPQRNTARAC